MAAHAVIANASCKRITVDGVSTPVGDLVTSVAIDAGVKELAKRAFDAQGLAAFDCSAEAAAIHEAGHCVMYATPSATSLPDASLKNATLPAALNGSA